MLDHELDGGKKRWDMLDTIFCFSFHGESLGSLLIRKNREKHEFFPSSFFAALRLLKYSCGPLELILFNSLAHHRIEENSVVKAKTKRGNSLPASHRTHGCTFCNQQYSVRGVPYYTRAREKAVRESAGIVSCRKDLVCAGCSV